MSAETESARSTLRWDDAPDLMTPAECAALLRAGRTSTYEAIRGGALKPIVVPWGRKYLIPKAALRRLVEGGDAS